MYFSDMRSWRAAVSLFILGLLLVQASWMLSVPSFRAIDEIDHTYRAASVARGDIMPSSEAAVDGGGSVVLVPSSLVAEAESACRALAYVGPDNCFPIRSYAAQDLVAIASTAAPYPPQYYAIVGWPSRLLEGSVALYAMRILSALLCAALVAAAAMTAMRARNMWLLAGVLVCMTPTFTYSTVVLAPNALSMSGGLLMWTAWLSADLDDPRSSTRTIALGGVGAVTTILTHTTGFIWVAGCLVVVWLARGAPTHRPVRRAFLASLVAVVAATAVMLSWNVVTGANAPLGEADESVRTASFLELLTLPLLWVFQSIFAVPRAGSFGHPLVYGISGSLIASIVLIGAISAGRLLRVAMAATVGIVTVLPMILTWQTQHAFGPAWQGRYAIPMGAGLVLMACWSIHARDVEFKRWHTVIVVPFGLAGALACASARDNLVREGTNYAVPGWLAPAIVLAGAVALWGCLESARRNCPAEARAQTRPPAGHEDRQPRR